MFVAAKLFGHFKFVHVILTDGDDNASKIDNDELFSLLEQIKLKLPPQFLKNIIIGVGVNKGTKSELIQLTNKTNGEFYDVQSNEIENIFQKISLSLGI